MAFATFDFRDACARHDFLHRNYRDMYGEKAFQHNPDGQEHIDEILQGDMLDTCADRAFLVEQSCGFTADSYYEGVRLHSQARLPLPGTTPLPGPQPAGRARRTPPQRPADYADASQAPNIVGLMRISNFPQGCSFPRWLLSAMGVGAGPLVECAARADCAAGDPLRYPWPDAIATCPCHLRCPRSDVRCSRQSRQQGLSRSELPLRPRCIGGGR
ncbi:phospholipase A2 [Streptomyces sp. NPDC029216]|uniref:phospholipase A2 n=1 Tax=Streptomyces sp. NPDC029216 TaxID=3154701 RepID=UPI0033FD69CC